MSFETSDATPKKLTTIAVVISASDNELADHRLVNAQLDEMQSVLAKLGFHAQTVLFGRTNKPKSDNQAISRSDGGNDAEYGQVFPSLNAAIETATKNTTRVPLALVDLNAVTSEQDWRWITESIRTSDIACCFHHRPSVGRKLTRVANFAKDQLSRLLMRSGKTESRPGLVVFKPEVAQGFVEEDIQVVAPEELVACCRSDGRTIAEAELHSSDAGLGNQVTLKPILASASTRLRFWWNTIAFPRSTKVASALPNTWTSTQWLIAFGIMLMAMLMFYTNLSYPLLEPDETRNAQLGLNLYQTGEWMSLTIDGEYYWDKPPLQAWMTAVSYHLFGANEFAARLPCATTSLICVLAILFLGSRLFGFRTASIAATALILSGGFTVVARYITMDASLCCFTTVMFLSILLATQLSNDKLRKRWLVLAGVACGLGLLVKGPVIGVIVMPPVLMAAWLQQKSFYTNPRFWLYLFAPAMMIAAPWFLATSIVHPEFIEYFLWKHHVVRFTDAFNHEQPWWFYLPVVLMMTYPAVFLLPQLFRLFRDSDRESRKELGSCFGPMLVYVLWVIGFFSLSQAKLPTYILPCIPTLCLLMGRTLDLGLGQQRDSASIQDKLLALPRTIAISVLIVLTASVGISIALFPTDEQTSLVVAGIAITACLVSLSATLRKSSSLAASFVPAIFAGAIFLFVCNGLILPLASDARSSQHAIKRLAGNPEFRDATVVYFGRPPRGTFFSIPDVEIKYFSDECRLKAVQFLASHPDSIVIASKDDVETLRREMNHTVAFDRQAGHRKVFICRSVLNHSDHRSHVRTSNAPHVDTSSTSTR